MTDPRPAAYVELRSALNGPLLAFGLLPLATEVFLLALGVAAGWPWCFVLMAAIATLLLISTGLLYRNWPTGVRMDESGISIGAVQSARAFRRRPTVSHQSWGVFTCPWSAVRSVRVVTDRDELRDIKDSPCYYTLTSRWGNKAGMRRSNTGVLTSPFMHAALVIEVDLGDVTATEIKSARYYSNFKDGHFSHVIEPQLSPTWVVPTRRPDRLRAALR